jgi:hypothetical protein
MTLPGLAAADSAESEAHTPLPVACSIKLRLGVRKPKGHWRPGRCWDDHCPTMPSRPNPSRAPLPDRARLQSRSRGGGGLAGP